MVYTGRRDLPFRSSMSYSISAFLQLIFFICSCGVRSLLYGYFRHSCRERESESGSRTSSASPDWPGSALSRDAPRERTNETMRFRVPDDYESSTFPWFSTSAACAFLEKRERRSRSSFRGSFGNELSLRVPPVRKELISAASESVKRTVTSAFHCAVWNNIFSRMIRRWHTTRTRKRTD